MDQTKGDTDQLQSSAENNHVHNTMAEKITVFILSIPIGQYAFQKIDGALQVIQNTAGWLKSAKSMEHSKEISKGHKDCQNGHAHTAPEEIPLPYDTRPLLSLLFLPFLFSFILCQLYVNIILFLIQKPPLKSADIERSIQKIRRHLTDLRLIGSKNIRNKQKLTAQRLNQNPPQLNVICRTFSKWPLKLFVRKLRKVLNFLGIITLPFPSDLKQNSVSQENVQNHEEQLIKNNEKTEAPKVEEYSEENSGSEESYDEEYYKDPVKTEPSRRVSVTVQEIILEENEEESITNLKLMKDQLNEMEGDQTEKSNNISNNNHEASPNFNPNEPVMVN